MAFDREDAERFTVKKERESAGALALFSARLSSTEGAAVSKCGQSPP